MPVAPRSVRRSAICRRTPTTATAGSRSRCRARPWRVLGVELCGKGDEVWFREVSPRPHDTGLVTLVSQELSEFALHARAILGLSIPVIPQNGPSPSCAVLVE